MNNTIQVANYPAATKRRLNQINKINEIVQREQNNKRPSYIMFRVFKMAKIYNTLKPFHETIIQQDPDMAYFFDYLVDVYENSIKNNRVIL